MIAIKHETQRILDLFFLLVQREIILKYKRTVLGFLWSLLNPFLTTLVLFLACKVFMRFEMKNYIIFLLSAMFPWNWFSGSVLLSVNAMTHNVSFIKKVQFPKYLLVLSLVSGQLVTLLLSLPILTLLMIYSGMTPHVSWLYGIPVMIILEFMTITGVALFISLMNAYFRDMEHVTGILMNILFWLTPVIYPLELIPSSFRPFLSLNPLFYHIQCWRDILMGNPLIISNFLYAGLSSLFFFAFGVTVYNRFHNKVDEVL